MSKLVYRPYVKASEANALIFQTKRMSLVGRLPYITRLRPLAISALGPGLRVSKIIALLRKRKQQPNLAASARCPRIARRDDDNNISLYILRMCAYM